MPQRIGQVLFAGLVMSIGAFTVVAATRMVFRQSFPSTSIHVGDLRVAYFAQTLGELRVHRSVENEPLLIGGVMYPSGIGTHANSEVKVRWSKSAREFKGGCGIHDNAGPLGSIVCSVVIGTRRVAVSPLLRRGDPAWEFVVGVGGVTELMLIATNGEDGFSHDHVNWVNLRLR